MNMRKTLDPYKGSLLAPLLKPRVPGTPGAVAARKHIRNSLTKFGWDVKEHAFDAETPNGSIGMANLVARYRPFGDIKPNITLAAHYDSKSTPEGFIGAIDSAFPCALMLWLAGIQHERGKSLPRLTFDLIFFDGEESFGPWSDTDSIYGAKALAKLQEQEGTLPQTLVLLDLIGHENYFPIPSWFENTYNLHTQLEQINPRLVGGRPLHEYGGYMQDDHLPYLERNVPVLHLIPPRFPDQWHTMEDNADCLHWDTMAGWADMLEKWIYVN